MYKWAAALLWAASFAHGEDAGAIARKHFETAVRLQADGRFRDAETQYARSIETWERAYGTQHPGLIRLLNGMTVLCLESRQFEKAETTTHRALDIQRAAPGAMPASDEATTLLLLGSVHRALHRLEESEAAYLEAERILQRDAVPDPVATANVWNDLGALYADWGKVERAASYLGRSLAQAGGGCSPESATMLMNVASVADRAGHFEAAGGAYARAADCARQAFGPSHYRTAEMLSSYARFLRARSRKREAARLETEARAIRALVAAGDESRYVVDARELREKGR